MTTEDTFEYATRGPSEHHAFINKKNRCSKLFGICLFVCLSSPVTCISELEKKIIPFYSLSHKSGTERERKKD